MVRQRKRFLQVFASLTAFSFFFVACSNLPLIGKKQEQKEDKNSEGKTVRIEGLENIKGVNPPKPDTPPPAQKPPSPPPQMSPPQNTPTASVPPRPSYSPPLPFFQMGFKKKLVILDFENKTTYQEEKIGEAVAKRLSDKLEATQRLVILDRAVVTDKLAKQGSGPDKLESQAVMKQAYRFMGIQAFVVGTVADVSLLSSKASPTSDEEVSFATVKVEIRLLDASTGNLLKTFIGRSPIFGTKETGENSRGKAVQKAIDSGIDDILEGFLRQIDLLDWSTTLAKIEGDLFYINAGRLSGLRIGDTLEVFEPGKEIIYPTTNVSLGWTTGKVKGTIRVTELFGVDAAVGRVVQGQGFSTDDVVKSASR
jgi:hypothetical protein